jgi:UrcA family protein
MSNLVTVRVARPRAKFGLILLGSIAGLIGAGAASAQDVPSVTVKYSEQNLATDAGANELYHRIVRAAKQACPEASIRDLKAVREVEACRNQAIARAVNKIDNSRLAAAYATHSKNS